ncbi:GTP cyclohydrolase [Robiginitalea sp.]|uniref:GTP cyclohydrolase n=1 Tax=Robiginitalea sp. TaxID=1902411 RepID=UPI003C78237D
MVQIKEVRSKQELKSFVKYPFALYRDSPYWVPPIIKEELDSFNPELNPVFEQAEARFFLAFKGGRIAGRIAAIVNRVEIEKLGLSKMRFGWMDFEDDAEVSKALLGKVAEIGRSHGLDFMEGPMGFSNLDKVGVLTEGFDYLGSMITWYNYPYYKTHLEDFGMAVEKEFIESKFPFSNVKPVHFERIEKIIRERYQLRPLNFEKTSQILPWAHEMFEVFNASYSRLSSFVPVSESQKEYFKKKYLTLIDPRYVKFVVDQDNRLVSFAIVMPSFSKALQKAGGSLFPFGFYHLLKARKSSKEVFFYLIGILPEYQKKGVTSIIFNEYYREFTARGIKMAYRTPELADNVDVHQIWKHFKPEVYKRRCTFRKDLKVEQ